MNKSLARELEEQIKLKKKNTKLLTSNTRWNILPIFINSNM